MTQLTVESGAKPGSRKSTRKHNSPDSKSAGSKGQKNDLAKEHKLFDGNNAQQSTLAQIPSTGKVIFKEPEPDLQEAWTCYSQRKRDYKHAKKQYEKLRKACKWVQTPPDSDEEAP